MPTLSQQTHLALILLILVSTFLVSTLLGRLQRGRCRAVAQPLLWMMMIGYLAAFVYLTVLCREPSGVWRAQLDPFWSYREAFSFDNGFQIRRLGVARQILLNCCLCMPLGYLLPQLLDKMYNPAKATMWTGFALSVVIEAVQYFTQRGLCELDDVIDNVLGCLIGLLAWMAVNALLDAMTRRR